MGNQTPNVEWQIVENEADWERLQTPPTPAIHAEVSRRLRLRRYLWGGAVLLLLVLGVGGEWWRSTQAASHQHAVGVQPTTQNEPESAGQRADSKAASLKGHPATMDGEHPV
ncbi:MAG TPA: hypothetical protein PKE45_08525 [Caldilineaceae bacterium]|nr:hypothetical protein [Caldilineaceae bacterium]